MTIPPWSLSILSLFAGISLSRHSSLRVSSSWVLQASRISKVGGVSRCRSVGDIGEVCGWLVRLAMLDRVGIPDLGRRLWRFAPLDTI